MSWPPVRDFLSPRAYDHRVFPFATVAGLDVNGVPGPVSLYPVNLEALRPGSMVTKGSVSVNVAPLDVNEAAVTAGVCALAIVGGGIGAGANGAAEGFSNVEMMQVRKRPVTHATFCAICI